jgi:hypothetical protein
MLLCACSFTGSLVHSCGREPWARFGQAVIKVNIHATCHSAVAASATTPCCRFTGNAAQLAGGREVLGPPDQHNGIPRTNIICHSAAAAAAAGAAPVHYSLPFACRFTGEAALPAGGREVLGPAETRIVETTPPGPKCPQGMCQVQPGITA